VVKQQIDKMTKRLRFKKKTFFILSLLITLSISLLLIGAAQLRSGAASDLLIVNGHETSPEQFSMYLGLKKALVVDYFKQTYGAEYTEQFWTTAYSGEVPLQKVMDEAKAELTKTIVMQQLAEKNGIKADISYPSFLGGMEAENRRRSKAAADGEIVYGPTSFDIEAYYSYYMSNLENATRAAMLENGRLSVSEEKVKQAYETEAKMKYTLPGALKLKWAALLYGDGTALRNKTDAVNVMKQLKQSASDLAGFVESAKQLEVEVMDASLSSATRRTAALESPVAVQQAERLQAGQSSEIFEENGELHLLYCISQDAPILLSYEEVKDSIASQWLSDQFRGIVEQELRKATVDWSNERAASVARSWLGIAKT